jgi:hypothetical protein
MIKRFPCKDEKMILKQNIRFRIIDTFGMNNRQVYIKIAHRHRIKEGLGWLRRVNLHNNIPTLKIRNKCEINGGFEFRNGDGCVNISTKTGQGVEDVLKLIVH